MVGLSTSGGTGGGASVSRNTRMKPRFSSKPSLPLSNIPEGQRQYIGIGELNRRINDLKMETHKNATNDIKTKLSTVTPQIRRDSTNSTVSSYYCSMRSTDMSRRSSQNSQMSSISTMRRMYNNSSSFYDPISPGSSRRSSQISMTTTGGRCLPPPPSSHLLTNHQYSRQQSGRLSHPNVSQNIIPLPDRRLSEPSVGQKNIDCNLLNNTNNACPTRTATNIKSKALSDLHPNQEVILDEMDEGEMVENKLVIPDEMLQYLNQVNILVDENHQPSRQQHQNSSNAYNSDNIPLNNMNPAVGNLIRPENNQFDEFSCLYSTDASHGRLQKHQNLNCGFVPNNEITEHNINAPSNDKSDDLKNPNTFGAQTLQSNEVNDSSDKTCSSIACSCLPGYYHKTNISAANCCKEFQMLLNQNQANMKKQCNKIQCDDISQSQSSPSNFSPQELNSNNMRQDVYQRTLEYVQNCQNWVDNNIVTSSTHPSSNLIINDMTTSLNSFQEENKFLQMIQ